MTENYKYNLVVENPESTVVAEYTPGYRTEQSYQSEAELEKAFIEQLQEQAYEYLSIKTEEDLKINLRKQLEKLNNLTFTDTEWEQFFKTEIGNPNHSIEDKTTTIQEDYIKILKRETEVPKTFICSISNTFITIICKSSINTVPNQASEQTATMLPF
jgi:type I restriction enzyme R subunit